MTYFQAIILGLVQGLGEFLPISSSGHLALLQYFFGIEGESVLLFAVMLHLGTLISVFVVYWRDIWELILELGRCIKDVFSGRGLRINANPTRRMGFMIIVATIPTALMGFFLKDIFGAMYLSLIAIGIGLLFTGTILWIAQRMSRGRKLETEMKFRSGIFVGIMQGLAITPGISRSGATLFGGLVTGLKKEFAVKFAFLLSIPAILGSFVVEFPAAIKAGLDGVTIGPLLVGVIVSAISGYVAIRAMIKIVSDKKLTGFSFYTWTLGAFVLIYGIFFA
ncbi:MAG: undecaprenyl-diphosphate phosphatase [Anaerovoracaceae bacterium]